MVGFRSFLKLVGHGMIAGGCVGYYFFNKNAPRIKVDIVRKYDMRRESTIIMWEYYLSKTYLSKECDIDNEAKKLIRRISREPFSTITCKCYGYRKAVYPFLIGEWRGYQSGGVDGWTFTDPNDCDSFHRGCIGVDDDDDI